MTKIAASLWKLVCRAVIHDDSPAAMTPSTATRSDEASCVIFREVLEPTLSIHPAFVLL